jgi:hypothetical protein
VVASIDLALDKGAHVAINYLNCPGFTDTPEEFAALVAFIEEHPVHMIQWRNLNFDPRRYVQLMNGIAQPGPPMGVATFLGDIQQRFPRLRHGYFNPPKESWQQP